MALPAVLLGWKAAAALAGGVLVASATVGRGNEHGSDRQGSRLTPRRLPPIGSVVYRDFWLFEHSGIHVGGGKFVSKAKTGRIVKESLDEFLDGWSSILVSANSHLKATGSHGIADRANAEVGYKRDFGAYGESDPEESDPEYRLLVNNCHIFTSYCITGCRNTDTCLSELKPTAAKVAGMTDWLRWEFD